MPLIPQDCTYRFAVKNTSLSAFLKFLTIRLSAPSTYKGIFNLANFYQYISQTVKHMEEFVIVT